MTEQLSGKPATTSGGRPAEQLRASLSEAGIDTFDALVGRLAAVHPRLAHEDHPMLVGRVDGGSSPPPKPH